MPKLLKENNTFLATKDFTKYEDLISESIEEIRDFLIERPKIIVFGKECRQNRNVGFFSDESEGHKYSGQVMKSQELTNTLKKLLKKVNKKYNSDYNGILINQYIDGSQYIGAHNDDESELDHKSGVISISYGSIRTFRIRDKESKKIVLDIPTEHCHIIQMGPGFQQYYTHEIPKTAKVKEERFSLTFRKHNK